MIEPMVLLASLCSALAVGALAVRVVPPTRRLGPRLRPYTIAARTSLGGSADVGAVADGGSGSAIRGVFIPLVAGLADRLSRLIDQTGDETLALRIRQAGLFPHIAEADRLAAYRARQLGSLLAWVTGAVAVSLVLALSTGRGVMMLVLAVVVGATRLRGRLDRAIEDRQARMRIEIYTVNQLLAVRARAGGGVVQAVSQLVARGRGEVVSELREALRLQRAGMRAADAFHRIAEQTPEPFCARTYSLLAVADDRGVDLAEGLLSLSEDVREARRAGIRRNATKRRAAMLVPTIAILAPVMLIFVAAPLPRLVLGWQ
jgi:tight adherence protein C